jgi:CBS domain-containing protein
MELDLAQPLRVKHVLTPLQYRVFPEVPLSEALELMARRELRSLPVVGQDLEVLGVITAGEALRQALEQVGRRLQPGTSVPPLTAGDVMSRTVMCVSEDQDLLDAAKVMAKRDVGQLPVVKEGEIIGVLSRDAVLKAVLGAD